MALSEDALVPPECFAGLRVLCGGDLMADRYVEGRAERISPEAPIPILRIEAEREMPGGAANLAANLAGLGLEAT